MEKDAKQSSVKSRLAVCGSRFLSGVGAAAAATAVVSPLLVPPEIAKETASVLLLTAATFPPPHKMSATGTKQKNCIVCKTISPNWLCAALPF